jgi:hypothetical protein
MVLNVYMSGTLPSPGLAEILQLVYLLLDGLSEVNYQIRWLPVKEIICNPLIRSIRPGSLLSTDKAFHVAYIYLSLILALAKVIVSVYIGICLSPFFKAIIWFACALSISSSGAEMCMCIIVACGWERYYLQAFSGLSLKLVGPDHSTCGSARFLFEIVDKVEPDEIPVA